MKIFDSLRRSLLVIALMLPVSFSCNKDVLDIPLQGGLSDEQINSYEDAEKLVIAAYSQLGNGYYTYPLSLWPFANVRSDDAYKGGRDPNDQADIHSIETFVNLKTNNGYLDRTWFRIYIGVERANLALGSLEKFIPDSAGYPDLNSRMGEMYFLRGYWYLKLKVMFKHIPYLNEHIPREDYDSVSNREYTDVELWDLIASDFKRAIDLLPKHQTEAGRPDKYAAYSYYARAKLYEAYRQNEENQVINIDPHDLQEVVSATGHVIDESPYKLETDYSYNFSPDHQNGVESIFAVQFSTDDGAGVSGRLDKDYYITAPMGLGCCDFQKISYNLVDAFKTTADGLPDFRHFNDEIADFDNDSFDPRLDHTVSRPGVPWQYDVSRIVTNSWSRTPSIYGYFNSMKENVSPDWSGYKIDGPYRGNSLNRVEMRFADVLLMRAEALIELGRQGEALPLINQVRERAKASTDLLVLPNGELSARYHMALYEPGTNITWTQENARRALRFERRLEFAMENMRFFDLVRWGVAETTMNAYIDAERPRRPNIFSQDVKFTVGRDEYFPIPQAQINFSKGLYKQNNGYQ